MGLRRQELPLSPSTFGQGRVGTSDFVESSVEIEEKHFCSGFQPPFIATWRILALAEKIFDCTNHGR
jgi:hypothetical protein